MADAGERFGMSIEEACDALGEHLTGRPWYVTVAIKSEDLIVYTNRRLTKPERGLVPEVWHDYEVTVKRMGKITPAYGVRR